MNQYRNDSRRTARHAALKRWVHLACIWSWPVGAVAFGIGFIGFAGMLPPPSPAWSAQEVTAFFNANLTGFRIGMLIAIFASSLLLPFYAVISEEMKKIEGDFPLLSRIQWGGAVVLTTFFQIIGLVWITASYRSEGNAEIIRTLNDYCWFVWSTLIPTYSLQYLCMAIAGFMDPRRSPLWPRWACYLNLWVAVTGGGGALAVFFKGGPFAWNGVIGFWIPVIVFALGMCVTAWLLYQRFRQEEIEGVGAAGLPDGQVVQGVRGV